MTSIVMKVFAVLDPLMGRVSLSANAGEPPALTEDQWIDLAQRHANADWNSGRPNGFLNAVKALCLDYSATPTAQAEGWRPIAEHDGSACDVQLYCEDSREQFIGFPGPLVGAFQYCAFPGGTMSCRPSHWRPLPPPPTSAEGVEHG